MRITRYATRIWLILLPLLLPPSVQADFLSSVYVQSTVLDEPVPFGRRGGLVTDTDGGTGFTSAQADVAITRDWGAASASARSSLASGVVGLTLESEGEGLNGQNRASIQDHLYFDGPDELLQIPVSIGINGSWNGGYVDADGSLFRGFFQNGFGEDDRLVVNLGKESSGDVLKDGLLRNTTYSKVVTVERGTRTLVGLELSLLGRNGIADFSNTGSITLDLPQGVTFTSDSGVFLSESPTVVPEPSTMTLLGIGLAALGGSGWRRRRKAGLKS